MAVYNKEGKKVATIENPESLEGQEVVEKLGDDFTIDYGQNNVTDASSMREQMYAGGGKTGYNAIGNPMYEEGGPVLKDEDIKAQKEQHSKDIKAQKEELRKGAEARGEKKPKRDVGGVKEEQKSISAVPGGWEVKITQSVPTSEVGGEGGGKRRQYQSKAKSKSMQIAIEKAKDKNILKMREMPADSLITTPRIKKIK